MKDWTYGAEHEFADWDRRKGMPGGFTTDPEKTIVNSNGIAWAPDWPFGGEFCTPPTPTTQGQGDMLDIILDMHPDCAVNYRSNLHVHVRVPGLKDDLAKLKKLAAFNLKWQRYVLELVEPIPEPTHSDNLGADVYAGARKRYRRRRVSHHTILGGDRVAKQLAARSLQEFFEAEVPRTKKTDRPMWHAQARAAVNVRQLLQTDTIEFRHFPGTLDVDELDTAVDWCRDYLVCAFRGWSPLKVFDRDYAGRKWPKFEPYVHRLELGWLSTTPDKTTPEERAEARRRLTR